MTPLYKHRTSLRYGADRLILLLRVAPGEAWVNVQDHHLSAIGPFRRLILDKRLRATDFLSTFLSKAFNRSINEFSFCRSFYSTDFQRQRYPLHSFPFGLFHVSHYEVLVHPLSCIIDLPRRSLSSSRRPWPSRLRPGAVEVSA